MEEIWKKLRPVQLIGHCAIEMDKSVMLKPMVGWKYAIRYLAAFFLVNVVSYSSIVYVYCTSPEGTMSVIGDTVSAIYKSTTDALFAPG